MFKSDISLKTSKILASYRIKKGISKSETSRFCKGAIFASKVAGIAFALLFVLISFTR